MSQPSDASKIEVANLPNKADMGFFTDPRNKTQASSMATVEPPKPIPPKDPETGKFVKAEAVKERHAQEMLDIAAYFGLDEASVADLPPHKLSSLLLKMQQQHLQQAKQDNLARLFEASQARTAAVEPAKPKDEFAEFEGIDLGTDEAGQPLSARDIHPGILRLLKAKLAPVASELSSIKSQTKNQHDSAVDDSIAALEATDYYGDGDMIDFAQGTPERFRRQTLYTSAGILPTDSARQIASKIKKADKILRTSSQAVPQANSSEYQAASSQAPSVPVFTEEQFALGGLNAPTSRELEEIPNGEEKAIRALEEKMGTGRSKQHAEILAGMLKR